ncbi:hypothetical protein [Nocardioides aquiterrae]|uniref:WD40 repeat domain-containing protein n=1 Tax=Nocardioides aquiterrae TaxID=203799 RepID=A0ABP4F423_9ACTN
MTTLHDRLADLADDAPPGGPAPGLWERGRRYHRQRRAGTLVIAAAVVLGLIALGSLDWWRARPEPMPANGAPALPQRIWMPSPWLPGTDETGPLGQLAALQPAARRSWTAVHDGVAGVSATTGEYAFLDLPDLVLTGLPGIALAPDGGHVAYWYSGETAKSPNSATGPVVGLAVYDTSTGAVVRHPVETDHGVDPVSLSWADPARVVYAYYQWAGGDADSDMERSSGRDPSGLRVWAPSSGRDDPVRSPGGADDVEASTAHGQVLVGSGGSAIVDVDRPDHAVRFTVPNHGFGNTTAIDDHGTWIAWPHGSSNPGPIAYGRIVEGERVDYQEVPGTRRAFSVRAWLDRHHVAAVQRVGGGIGPSALFSIDVRTGTSTEILRYPLDTYGTTTLLATDLIGAPTAERPAPPTPLDPRKVAGGAVAVVLGGLGALVLWRRRVRA